MPVSSHLRFTNLMASVLTSQDADDVRSAAGRTCASERDLSECSKLWLVCSLHLPAFDVAAFGLGLAWLALGPRRA